MRYEPKQEQLFESSKLKQLDVTIKNNNVEKMNSDELLAHIAYRALTDQQLRRVYWSNEVQEFADLAIKLANEESMEKKRLVQAKLNRNQAQIIIRDTSNDNFCKAEKLLHDALSTFEDLAMKHEILFTKDEILRTKFKCLAQNTKNSKEEIDQIHQDWLDLLSRFACFVSENEGTSVIWYRNAIKHFLEFCAYFQLKKHGYVCRALKLFAKDNRKKAIECGLYGLGRIGYQVVVKLKN